MDTIFEPPVSNRQAEGMDDAEGRGVFNHGIHRIHRKEFALQNTRKGLVALGLKKRDDGCCVLGFGEGHK